MATAQVVVAQVPVPFAGAQGTAQAPQFVVVVSGASQPSVGLALQLPKLPVQAPSVQTPPGQVSVAFARSQSVPQPPQLPSVLSGVSQPLDGSPSQLP